MNSNKKDLSRALARAGALFCGIQGFFLSSVCCFCPILSKSRKYFPGNILQIFVADKEKRKVCSQSRIPSCKAKTNLEGADHMRPFKFVHGADLHLDSSFSGLARVSEELQKRLRTAVLNAVTRMVDLCLEEKVDFVVLAGDIYDSNRTTLWTQRFLREQLLRLADAGISVYIIHGNHDPMGAQSFNLPWPENVHRFSSSEPESVVVVKDGVEIAQIVGMSYQSADEPRDLSEVYVPSETAPYTIGLLHASVDGLGGQENYSPTSLSQLVEKSFNYWALGHVHRPQILFRDPQCTVAYSGSIQGLSPAETGERGVFLVSVDENGTTNSQFVPLADVIWETLEVSITELSSLEDLLDTIEDGLDELAQCYPRRAVMTTIKLVGRGGLHPTLQREDMIAEILESLRERCRSFADEFVYPHRIQVSTRRNLDLDRLSQAHPFLGEFLAVAEQALVDEELKARLEESLKPLFHHRQFKRHLTPLADGQLTSLLETAKLLALDMMLGEEE